MTCPYLEYRDESGDRTFDVERAYCGVVERFVEPMRADICNDRYDLHHATHCEIFREHEGGEHEAGEHEESGGADGEGPEPSVQERGDRR